MKFAWLEKIRKKLQQFKRWRQSVEQMPPTLLPEDEPFVADSKAALLNRVVPSANVIIYTVALFIFVALIWSYFAEIDQSTTGEGKVIPSSQVKIIQSLDGGILDKVLVREGQVVKKGQLLVHLEGTRYVADYNQNYSRYLALLAQVARLYAETTGQHRVDFPEIVRREQPELVRREENLFKIRQQGLIDELAVSKNSYELAAKNVAILKPLAAQGIVAKVDLIRAERDANDMKGKLLETKAKFHEEASTELNLRKADLNSLKENLVVLQDKMKRTDIASPVNGIVKKINIYTPGGVISPGADIMEVVPLEDTLLVEVFVSPAEIGFIRLGDAATVRVNAYDYSRFGFLMGKVEYISADSVENNPGLNNRMSMTSPASISNAFYILHIRTKKNYLMNDHQKLPIIPGMTVTAQIKTGKRTIWQYIMKPLFKAQHEALQEK